MTPEQRCQVERLFASSSRGVASFVLACAGSAELAEEITARVFATVVRKFDQCRGSPAGWLWAIVHSELADHFRRRRPHEPLSDAIPSTARSPEEQAVAGEDRRRLWSALRLLPEAQQRLLYMKYFLDMPNVEIARAEGLTASNVGVLSHRAIKRLRQLLRQPTDSDRRRTGQPTP